MDYYKSSNGIGLLYISGFTILFDAFMIFLLGILNIYEFNYLLKVLIVGFNIYQVYYLMTYITLKYSIADEVLCIEALWGLKKVKIPFSSMKKYNKRSGSIKGVRLFGYGNNFFALGKFIIEKIGTTYMYVTTNKEVFYIKTDHVNYAVSPVNESEFDSELSGRGIKCCEWEFKVNDESSLREEKKFKVLFLLCSFIIIVLTLTPLILYMYNKLPAHMPLKFDGYFKALKSGTAKEFVLKQMTYGALNMAILFCMYFASHFSAKYDKKSAYYYIYVSLIIALAFLIIQFRILFVFR